MPCGLRNSSSSSIVARTRRSFRSSRIDASRRPPMTLLDRVVDERSHFRAAVEEVARPTRELRVPIEQPAIKRGGRAER